MPPDLRACVTDALRALDVRNLTVCVHDASFPSDAGEDIGRGSPCSRGGLRFLHFARALGFTGLQLGPDGQTPPDDPSPYRGAAFPRNTLSIALAPLAADAEWAGLLARAVAARPAGAREHAAHGQAREIQGRALRVAFDRLAAADRPLVDEQRRFERANAAWLERYELFEVLQRLYGTRDVRRWDGPAGDGLDARLWDGDDAARAARRRALRTGGAGSIAFFRFAQFVAQTQRRRFAAAAAELGLRLFADLPIGLSVEDEWCHPGLFLDGYRMGAPPSRTNPEGQAWGYPLFDPRRYIEPAASGARPGPVLRFLAARLDRMRTTHSFADSPCMIAAGLRRREAPRASFNRRSRRTRSSGEQWPRLPHSTRLKPVCPSPRPVSPNSSTLHARNTCSEWLTQRAETRPPQRDDAVRADGSHGEGAQQCRARHEGDQRRGREIRGNDERNRQPRTTELDA